MVKGILYTLLIAAVLGCQSKKPSIQGYWKFDSIITEAESVLFVDDSGNLTYSLGGSEIVIHRTYKLKNNTIEICTESVNHNDSDCTFHEVVISNETFSIDYGKGEVEKYYRISESEAMELLKVLNGSFQDVEELIPKN